MGIDQMGVDKMGVEEMGVDKWDDTFSSCCCLVSIVCCWCSAPQSGHVSKLAVMCSNGISIAPDKTGIK